MAVLQPDRNSFNDELLSLPDYGSLPIILILQSLPIKCFTLINTMNSLKRSITLLQVLSHITIIFTKDLLATERQNDIMFITNNPF